MLSRCDGILGDFFGSVGRVDGAGVGREGLVLGKFPLSILGEVPPVDGLVAGRCCALPGRDLSVGL